MKPVLLGVSGIALAFWSAAESAALMAQIGPDTGVGLPWVFQAGVLVAAAWMLLKFGMTLKDWKNAIDQALLFSKALQSLDDRQSRYQERTDGHEILLAEHNKRLHEHAAEAESIRERVVALNEDVTELSEELTRHYRDIDECRKDRERLEAKLDSTDGRVLTLERRVREGGGGTMSLGRAGGAA